MIFTMARTKRMDGGPAATTMAATRVPCFGPDPDLACISDLPDELPVRRAEVKLVRAYFRDLIDQTLRSGPDDL